MPYINVDKPKFFINELQYQNSLDNLFISAWHDDNYVAREIDDLSSYPIFNHPEKTWVDVIGYNEGTVIIEFRLKTGYWNDILLAEDTSGNNQYGAYAGIFGHELVQDTFDVVSGSPGVYNSDNRFNPFVNIVNAIVPNNLGVEAEVPGWSMVGGLGHFVADDQASIYVKFPVNYPFGCISIGNYYSPEHNPDMGYSINHTHDGTKFTTTRGGSTFSNTYYSGPPNWSQGGAAWELGYFDEDNDIQPAPIIPRLGRRIFNFNWTGMADTSIMPLNSLSTTHMNENDSTKSIDFYTQVIKKTLDQSFIFTSNSTTYDPESFMIARWASPSLNFNNVTPKIYSFSKQIIESW